MLRACFFLLALGFYLIAIPASANELRGAWNTLLPYQ
jgi:hypothetical protein